MKTYDVKRLDAVAQRTIIKVYARVVPFLFMTILAAFIDRTNVSIAALDMNGALRLTPAMFGFGSGLIAVGQGLFAFPSSVAARHFGAHRWIPMIMIFWGVAASAMSAIEGPKGFYVDRLSLGVIEAGLFPTILLATTVWIPAAYRARAIAAITAAGAVALVIGLPLGGAVLLRLDGLAGMAGWRWLFIVEGTPLVCAGVVALLLFPDGPQSSRWLTSAERAWLVGELEKERTRDDGRLARVRMPRTIALYLALAAFVNFAAGAYVPVIILWLPQIGHDVLHLALMDIGKLLTPLYLIGVLVAYLMSHLSDRRRRRYPFVIGCLLTACLSLFAIAGLGIREGMLVATVFAFLLIQCIPPILNTGVSEDLSAGAAAKSFGISVLAASVGQFLGNWGFGLARDHTGDFSVGLLILSGLLSLATLAAFQLGKLSRALREPAVGQ